METISVNTSQHINIDYPVAGLGERVAARLIDFGIMILVFLVFLMFFSFSGLLADAPILGYILLIIYGLCFIFYDLLFEIFMNGQSIGKRLMKIKVISLNGAQPSLGQYLIRWIFRTVDFTLTSWLGALVCVAVTENKQRIGDIVAGTTLIKTVPPTRIEHLAFKPVDEEYIPVFDQAAHLNDKDIELIHEVLSAFYKTRNPELIYQTTSRITQHLSIRIPSGMNELLFLETLIKDYSHITANMYR